MKYSIGDIVTITNEGATYVGYYQKAEELLATNFVPSSLPSIGEAYVIRNKKPTSKVDSLDKFYYLVEGCDGKQYVTGACYFENYLPAEPKFPMLPLCKRPQLRLREITLEIEKLNNEAKLIAALL